MLLAVRVRFHDRRGAEGVAHRGEHQPRHRGVLGRAEDAHPENARRYVQIDHRPHLRTQKKLKRGELPREGIPH